MRSGESNGETACLANRALSAARYHLLRWWSSRGFARHKLRRHEDWGNDWSGILSISSTRGHGLAARRTFVNLCRGKGGIDPIHQEKIIETDGCSTGKSARGRTARVDANGYANVREDLYHG
jgi:hypothetical protein